MTGWLRHDIAVMVANLFSGGPVGEGQVGEAYTARWMRPLTATDPASATPGSPTWAIVDCIYYGARCNGLLCVRVAYTFIVCTDPAQPDTSRTSSPWVVDSDVDLDLYNDVDVADERIRELTANDGEPDDIFWNEYTEFLGYAWMTLDVAG